MTQGPLVWCDIT